MTYIKFDRRTLESERWLDATPAAFTLHTWLVDWCNGQMTDGRIPAKRAVRMVCPVPPADIPAALDILVGIGEWERQGEDYVCPNFLSYGIGADEQQSTLDMWARDKRRQRLCRVGNHDLCGPRSKCASTGGVHNKTSGRPDQTRPDQTPSGFGMGAAGEASADAEPAAGAGNDPPASPQEVEELQALKARWAAQREEKRRRRLSPVREDAS